MVRILCFILLFLPLTPQAQFTYSIDYGIPVTDLTDHNLPLAWAGGLNAAQYNTIDLNGDGADDLALFDRMAGQVITFLSEDGNYVPAPEYENLFPPDIANWLLLRDYNCDGKKDIFTGDILGIKVYQNTASIGSPPAWTPLLFFSGFSGPKSTVVLTQGFTSKINLQLQSDDLPSISDVDGDGDLDIFNMRFASNGTVEFHKNFSIERYGTCDSLDFERVTQSWGGLRECHCGEFAFNGTDCPAEGGGRVQHVGGKSLLALDLNGDQEQELLFSEATCAQLYSLPNEGTTFSPVINSFSPFPDTHPANLVLFPSPYFEDVDFDGKKDLIVTPNIFSKEFLNSNLRQSNWFYKNTGTNTNPLFSFVEPDFLQNLMIDVGDNAVPAFADYDADGDTDMFISQNSSENFSSSVYLFENSGTPSAPAFRLSTYDYLGFAEARLYNVKIQFADVNGDSKTDFVFTGTSFDTGLTRLYFIPNKSQTSFDFTGSSSQILDFQLSYNENIYLTDINEDGLTDVLAGRSGGQLEYWLNSGTKESPSFVLEAENFLGLGTSFLRQNITCSVADLDADGKRDLVIGDQSGRLGIIPDFLNGGSSPSVIYDIVYNKQLKTYGEKNLGGPVWPAVGNLFGADKPAILVGNILGGVHVLKNDEGKSLPENWQVDLYPNPVERSEVLHVKSDRYGTLRIISVLGQQLSHPVAVQPNEIYQYNLPHLAAGIYLLQFTVNNKSQTRRLVIK